MDIFYSIDLLIYSELILIYIIFHIYKQNTRNEWSTKLFLVIAYTLSAVNILEGVTWVLNGIRHPWGVYIIYVTNTLLLAFNSLPAVVWVAYADYKIFNDMEKLKKRFKWYLIPFYISVILLLLNLSTGIVFTVDENNVYSRSIGVYIIAMMTYLMITILYINTKKYKKQIDGKVLQSIFLFMLIPIIAGIIQMLIYGTLLIWPAFILATLIAFIQVEKDAVLRDPLTGLPTRKSLEQRLQYLLNKKIKFSIIMADMDGFKQINDLHGHPVGDQALITAASILKHNVKIYDMVCRYGGDEFIVLVESDDEDSALGVMERIQKALKEYNEKEIQPYRLSMSFGHAFVRSSENTTLQDILNEADDMMYSEKEEKKRIG